jgi:SAM-dependent methyltransferase
MTAFKDINDLLHAEREVRVSQMPGTNGTLLSAGCAGKWYFDWIEAAYGHVENHVGVEFYSPKPTDLPANVKWITNTVGNMRDVRDASVDVLFSGQNLEHLWPSETVHFLAESARVVKQGGTLVIDSPNRHVTGPLVWSHPEHTVELTPVEACRLATLAGFDVNAIHGMWLVRDQQTGAMLQLSPEGLPESEIAARIEAGRSDPDNAMLWWIEAVRSERPCDFAAVKTEMRRIFELAWPERCQRFVSNIGTKQGDWREAQKGEDGALIFGPYMPLPKGDYEVHFNIDTGASDEGIVGRCDVIAGSTELSVFLLPAGLDGSVNPAVARFSLKESMTFGVQARVFNFGNSTLRCSNPRIIGADPSSIWDATWLPN